MSKNKIAKNLDLNSEYFTKAAQAANERYTKQQHRTISNRSKDPAPPASREELTSSVQQLGDTWGANVKLVVNVKVKRG